MQKIKINISIKFLVFALISVMIFVAPLSIILGYDQHHFPEDSLSNYPDTQWICDKLALKFSVDENGTILGEYKAQNQTITLDVIAHPSDSGHANNIECTGADGKIELTCFYRNVSEGKFYATIVSASTSIDLCATESVPYKFEMQDGNSNISTVQVQKDSYMQGSHFITALCVAIICVLLLLLGRKMNALQGKHIKHTDLDVLKTGKKCRLETVFLTVFCVILIVYQLLLTAIPFVVFMQWIFSKNTSWSDFEMVAIAVVKNLYIILPLCVINCLCSLAGKMRGIKAKKFGCNTKILRLTDALGIVTYTASAIICWFVGLNTIAYIALTNY